MWRNIFLKKILKRYKKIVQYHTYARCHNNSIQGTRVCKKHTKKREVRSFFTLDKGFAIPAKSRKTTEVHARYIHPTTPRTGVDVDNTYPRGHSLRLSGLLAEFCEDSVESQTTSINAFYVTGLRSRFDQSEMVFHQIRCKITTKNLNVQDF